MTRIDSFLDIGKIEDTRVTEEVRKIACIQGLGFVGTAMAVAVADARDESGSPCFNVVGVELADKNGRSRVATLNSGSLNIVNSDRKLQDAFTRTRRHGNFVATTDPAAYALASVVVVDMPLDVIDRRNGPSVDFGNFAQGIRTIADNVKPGVLIIIETTVPPGTCEKVVVPEIESVFRKRGFPPDSFFLAHSYERVMPGKEYYNSIINFWRVYAGHNHAAAEACEEFLTKVINIRDYPLRRLSSTTASETAKVLENSYRAENIAFIEEWGRFAEAVGIDLFEVIEAIRVRPTHSNIRQPGFGVGGYCLTKDPLLGRVGARQLFGLADLDFPFCSHAVEVNRRMPLVTLRKVQGLLGGSLGEKRILLCGVSYRPDIGDTRQSPSETFVRNARNGGAIVLCHDPLVEYWPELDMKVLGQMPGCEEMDAVVFAVAHEEYRSLDFRKWLNKSDIVIFDANNVLTREQIDQLKRMQVKFASIGRG